jgi:hypothetical protein
MSIKRKVAEAMHESAKAHIEKAISQLIAEIAKWPLEFGVEPGKSGTASELTHVPNVGLVHVAVRITVPASATAPAPVEDEDEEEAEKEEAPKAPAKNQGKTSKQLKEAAGPHKTLAEKVADPSDHRSLAEKAQEPGDKPGNQDESALLSNSADKDLESKQGELGTELGEGTGETGPRLNQEDDFLAGATAGSGLDQGKTSAEAKEKEKKS